ncbi:hypothetical protein J4217_04530 [Candidatus Pacearchaeota archaeon]|nr:hypothetical protein [Candidatus Pacearchaeota archaeon]
MLTPTHLTFSLILYGILAKLGIVALSPYYLTILFSAELIDLDHLFSRPIYARKRNPFKIHFFHKNWIFILIVAATIIFIKPFFLLGLGLELHLLMDFIYVKMNKL